MKDFKPAQAFWIGVGINVYILWTYFVFTVHHPSMKGKLITDFVDFMYIVSIVCWWILSALCCIILLATGVIYIGQLIVDFNTWLNKLGGYDE